MCLRITDSCAVRKISCGMRTFVRRTYLNVTIQDAERILLMFNLGCRCPHLKGEVLNFFPRWYDLTYGMVRYRTMKQFS